MSWRRADEVGGAAPLDFPAFADVVLGRLEVRFSEPVRRSDSLYDDVGLDSVQAFELLAVIDELADLDVPPRDVPELFTMDDAHRYYRSLLGPTSGTPLA